MIRLAQPDIDDADIAAVAGVLRTGFLVQGQFVADFEKEVAERVGLPHAIAVANCTSALHMSLLALGIRSGDAVAVAAYSWPATANVVALCGGEVAFVDIDPRTWNMDPESLRATLAARSDIRAIIPVHVFGGMADMPAIRSIAAAHGVPVVEDAACALGAVLHGRSAGAWGRIGCFSFHPRKPITTGEGGIVVTADSELAYRCRALRNHGLDPASPEPDFILPGFNLRMTEMQAALGAAQLRKLDRLLDYRRKVASWYAAALAPLGVALPTSVEPSSHVHQAYVVLLPPHAARGRRMIIAGLREMGVETSIGTYHQPLTRVFRDRNHHRTGDFPVTDEVAARALALPMHSRMGPEEVAVVAQRLDAVLSRRS